MAYPITKSLFGKQLIPLCFYTSHRSVFRCIFTITSGAVTDESAVPGPASPNAGVANNLPGYCVRAFLSLLPLSCLALPLFVTDTPMQGNIGGVLSHPELPITCLGHADGLIRDRPSQKGPPRRQQKAEGAPLRCGSAASRLTAAPPGAAVGGPTAVGGAFAVRGSDAKLRGVCRGEAGSCRGRRSRHERCQRRLNSLARFNSVP